jgi:glycogen debranching enzyme
VKDRGELIASNCNQAGWSTAFFWDSLVAAAGIAQFNPALAENAIEVLYVRQREDGCVPTSNYEYREGSTFYPQAPISGWSLTRLWEKGRSADFIARIIGKVDKLFHWFILTQDHDGDGLPEWRFTGCPADNSPLYDGYAIHTQRDLALTWCIYLPPVASVSLASYLIMDAKCLAFLYKQLGNGERSAYFIKQAGLLETRLKEICVKDGNLFFDYDHHLGRFNQALTLHSFLPLWAGVELDAAMKKRMIEEYLLNSRHFFGEKPFPYLAYSEDAYTPTGYWRGRIWTHVSFWIVEALWAEGYEKEADEAADRLIRMINQQEKFLENYHSSPDTPGGGSTDYNWGMAAYLLLADRTYRKPVTLTVR